MLGLRPWELARLTPAELVAMATGRQRRDERRKWELAWAVAHLVAATGMVKRPPQVVDLMVQLVGEERMAQLLDEELTHRGKG